MAIGSVKKTAVLLFAVLSCVQDPARAALACNFSMTTMNFGSVDVTLNTTFSITGTLSASCSGGNANQAVRICVSFGGGTGDVSGSGAPRYLANGANLLDFNLYENSGHSDVWGSYSWGGAGGPGAELSFTLNGSGSGSANKTVYGLVNAAQQTKPAGTYSSTFNATHVQTNYGYTSQGSCASLSLPNFTNTPTFTVSATVPATCRISATAHNFGSASALASNVDATSTLTATCTSATPYNIGLNVGNGAGATVAVRKMTNGANTINYSLYRNSTRTNVWGTTIGTNTLSATGSGLGQSHTVYGRVPSQATPASGTYSDTIVTTVTY